MKSVVALAMSLACPMAPAFSAVGSASPAGAAMAADYLLTSTSVDQILTGGVGGVWTGTEDLPAGSDVALVLGPTGIPQPSDAYLQTAYNLYLEPTGLYEGPEANVYSLYTPEEAGSTSVGVPADEGYLSQALLPLLQNGDHVTLFGYSQSTAAISAVLNQLTAEYGDQYADQITFVMVGDSGSPDGMLANIYESLPSWGQSIVLQNASAWGLTGGVMNLGPDNPPADDITPDGPYHGDVFTLADGGALNNAPDGFASWSPDSFSDPDHPFLWLQELIGLFSTHEEYLGMTPADVSAALAQADPDDPVNYLTLHPTESPLELLTQAAADAGWLPVWLADPLLDIGL